MQLKFSVGDEMHTIDVTPSDTFHDISEKLFKMKNINIDMSQLGSSSNDKPFDLSTNVMEYFSKNSSKNDQPGEQPSKIVNESKTVIPTAANIPNNMVCRLCGGVLSSDFHMVFSSISEDGTSLATKINTCLPIHVSRRDTFSKQVCGNCLAPLERNFSFVKMVLDAQTALQNRAKFTKVRHKDEKCSICHNGHMRQLHCRNGGTNSRKASDKATTVVQIPKAAAKRKEFGGNRVPLITDNIYQAEYYDNDEVITDQWEPSGSSPVLSMPATSEEVPMQYSASPSGSWVKKYRKRPKNEDDQDWSIDQEYVPVNKRGRPKGTKNKPKMVSIIERTCILCEWLGADTDMLAHTINVHCQPDLDFFPCPMCKTCHPNEIELEAHIEEHIKLARSE